MAAKKKGGTGHRLTTKQKNAIASASPDVTNTELAKKFGTTMGTITRYRATTAMPKATRRGSAAASGDASKLPRGRAKQQGTIQMDSDGDFIVLRIHKSRRDVVQGVVDQLLT